MRDNAAVEALKARYVRGEIEVEELEERLPDALTSPTHAAMSGITDAPGAVWAYEPTTYSFSDVLKEVWASSPPASS